MPPPGSTTIVKWVDADGNVHMVDPAHPLPVMVAIAAVGLTIDPFDNVTVNIDPAVVRSSATGAFRLAKVHCHFAAVTSNPVVIALDAHQGPEYDTILRTIPMGAVQDLTALFDDSHVFEAGDVITVAWTNDIGVGVAWAVEIGWEE